jgi:D-3-phosphoglycerate dehydrogenase / 2-oxoglutarate reductase
MRILIADKVSDELIARLTQLSAQVVCRPDLDADSLPEAIGDASVLLVRSTKVLAKTIEAATHLSLIVRAGAGVNTIDLEAASNAGVYVANCPGVNTDAVAELAIGLLIGVDRGIADATQALRSGKWQKKRFGKGQGLKGRTLGIVGAGQIGLAVARRAQALEMRVLAWSRSLTRERAEQLDLGYAPALTELAQASDAVTVHLALNKETNRLLGREFFGAMKARAIFVNTSRGEIVDPAALVEAINAKGLRVGLDVFDNEPAGGEAPFAQTALAGLVTCTPHIGASTDQATEAIANEVYRIVESFFRTGQPLHVVNLRNPVTDETKLVIRHFNRVGVLARVLTKLRDEDINIEEMQNSIFKNDKAACCSLSLDKPPSDATLQALRSDQDVIEVTM